MATVGGLPEVADLLAEYTRAGQYGRERAQASEEVRFSFWESQSPDGKKHDAEDEQAFPWNHASDTRIRLADAIVNESADILVAAFNRAQFEARGIELQDAAAAGAISKTLEWARNGGIPDLSTEVDLAADYGQAKGWCILQVIWSRRIARRAVKVSLEQLAARWPELNLAILDPIREEEAIQAIQTLYPLFVQSESPSLAETDLGELKPARARKIVRALRADGETEVPIPYLHEDNPRVIALEPWEDVFVPPETTDLQRARAIFRVDWMNETELRAKVASDQWNEAWVDAVLTKSGQNSSVAADQNAQDILDASLGLTSEGANRDRRNLCEVVYAYTRGVDEDGVEQVRYTVFSPHVIGSVGTATPEYAVQGTLDYAHGKYPFVAYRREQAKRKLMASRGVPEIVMTWQQEKKAQRDAQVDRTSLSIVPPLLVPQRRISQIQRLGPAQRVGYQSKGEIEWMQPPPGNPAEAVELIREIDRESDEYFGRLGEGVDPVRAQTKQQRMVDQWLLCWVEVFRQVTALCSQYLSDEEWLEISGAPAPERRFESLQRGRNWQFKFDVRELSTDYMVEKLKAIGANVLPLDAGGVVDRSKLVAQTLAWIDPSLARAVVSDQTAASQKLFKQVQDDFAQMALGNEVSMTQNDPTAPRQLEYARQIVTANPKYQQALAQDERFQQLTEQWGKNKEFSAQQERNKITGRIGVETSTPIGR